MRTWMLLIALLFSARAQAADLPDLVFQAVEGERVSLTREDGWQLEGTLVGFSDAEIVLRLDDGKMQVVSTCSPWPVLDDGSGHHHGDEPARYSVESALCSSRWSFGRYTVPGSRSARLVASSR